MNPPYPFQQKKPLRDPFAGGLQTAADRIEVIRYCSLQELEIILARKDLQPSVRARAELRQRRLQEAERIPL
jgi:hypothetical protein